MLATHDVREIRSLGSMLSARCFWTGMTTAGRSERMNAYFDGYVCSKTMLNEFLVLYTEQFMHVERSRRRKTFK